MLVGDIATVINKGKLYSTYEEFFVQLCPEYLEGYRLAMLEYDLKKGDAVEVLFVHKHTLFRDTELCVVEPVDKPGRYYLIGSAGLEGEPFASMDSSIFSRSRYLCTWNIAGSEVPHEIDVSNDDLMSLLG